ncbi:hypothetical protein [Sporosarcina sp. BP05]|uniref:ParM/StbA family protein n=1 Tax=Sporosarcina sp. BP05 TaxID=2758726 RepID=UPI0016463FD6|nr:hypothetical protein [Sporosarcina sp. BP05]
MINFGIDFGNGYVKAVSEKGSFVIPSLIAIKDLEDNAVSSAFKNDFKLNTFKRKQDDHEYLFGEDIAMEVEEGFITTTNSNNKRYETIAFQQMADFALAELASYEDESKVDVRLVTGMPSNEIQFATLKKDFSSFLKGVHVVSRNGQDIIIDVKEVVIIEQPLGTLFNLYLNDKSQVHDNFKFGNIVVIDFGSGTTIIDEYKNMKRADGKTIKSGMRNFYKNIAKTLSKKSEQDVDPLHIEEGIRNETFLAKFGQSRLSFQDIFDKEVTKKLNETLAAYEDTVDEQGVTAFVTTGGGAIVFNKVLKQQKNNFIPTENSQMATANGCLKLAKSFDK